MKLTTEALEVLVAKGLSAADILDVARALDVRRDPTAAERMRRHRAKKVGNGVTRNVTQDVTPAPPNEYISNPPEPSEASASLPPLLEKVVSEWNTGPAANGARKATKLDASRKALLRARLRDHGEAELFAAMANLAASKFHCGENDRGWRANLGWFLEAKNFLKALEMTSDASAQRQPAKPMNEADRAAYLLKLNDNPMFSGTRQAPATSPRTGSTGPPRPIGDLIQLNR